MQNLSNILKNPPSTGAVPWERWAEHGPWACQYDPVSALRGVDTALNDPGS